MENISSKNIFHLGIVNSSLLDIGTAKKYEKIANLHCIIFGLKNSIFFGRDWILINSVKDNITGLRMTFNEINDKDNFLIKYTQI